MNRALSDEIDQQERILLQAVREYAEAGAHQEELARELAAVQGRKAVAEERLTRAHSEAKHAIERLGQLRRQACRPAPLGLEE